MKAALDKFLHHACPQRRGDELLLALVVYVVCFVLFAR